MLIVGLYSELGIPPEPWQCKNAAVLKNADDQSSGRKPFCSLTFTPHGDDVCCDEILLHVQAGESDSKTESGTETKAEPEGELRVEAEQKTGVDDALASPTAAATFEEPPSEAEVRPSQCPIAI